MNWYKLSSSEWKTTPPVLVKYPKWDLSSRDPNTGKPYKKTEDSDKEFEAIIKYKPDKEKVIVIPADGSPPEKKLKGTDGFQVSLNGKYWVTARDALESLTKSERKKEEPKKKEEPVQQNLFETFIHPDTPERAYFQYSD
jgi:hypothetical protein